METVKKYATAMTNTLRFLRRVRASIGKTIVMELELGKSLGKSTRELNM